MASLAHPIDATVTMVRPSPYLSDSAFLKLYERWPDYRLEYDAPEQEVVMAPPTEPETGERNSEITAQLHGWNRSHRWGRVLDSSSGTRLPNRSIRAVDASWIARDRFDRAMAQRGDDTYPVLCPDFVIELRSPSDRLPPLKRKMQESIDNGALLACLVDPIDQTVTIYRPGTTPESLAAPSSVAGEGPVEGFLLDLTAIWPASRSATSAPSADPPPAPSPAPPIASSAPARPQAPMGQSVRSAGLFH